ncbi:MAG: hypothetical protein GY806_02065 [Gammaproteobacteria bacterium]|nr:hypothetical protein [Gammaproteobacteria bacterium]
MRIVLTFSFIGLLITACATTPVLDTTFVDKTLTPENVQLRAEAGMGKTVLWGGTILDFKNLQNSSQMEILAYPLNRSQRPLQNKKPLGRFILLHPGFLEPTVYMQGKLLSATGTIGQSQAGKIGQSEYVYPVLKAEQIQLWSPRNSSVRTGFHIGIGLRF